MKQRVTDFSLPTVEQLEAELEREKNRGWRKRKSAAKSDTKPAPELHKEISIGPEPAPSIAVQAQAEPASPIAVQTQVEPASPIAAQLEAELERTAYRKRYWRMLRSTLATLLVVAAAVVLLSNLLPILRIYGSSMTPTLVNGDLAAAVRQDHYARGDIIAFYYNNKLLVKRVIGLPGEWIDIDEAGNVYIDGQLLEEDYLTEKSLGECDIEWPYQVPDGRYFVLGDHRSVSSDSRNSQVGCAAEEQIVGKLIFLFWPLDKIGTLA